MLFNTQADLFSPHVAVVETVKPWRPVALSHSQWPPEYRSVYAFRIKQLEWLRADPANVVSAKAYYATRPAEFIADWMDTYNPRKADAKWMPFVLFTRQHEFIEFLHGLRHDGENGLVEKCRDAGATWLSCAYSVWSWLFIPGDAIGWGSRKQDLVDKLGDPDSIFEKMRLIIKKLPDVFKPVGFRERDHATYLKLVNPENGSTITGEAGDNIGRGGRKSMYFKDESAHYERPEKIEAALGDNTNVQVDISSVNGLGNVFYRRRESGILWQPGVDFVRGMVRVFIIDWTDHPEKTQEWYDERKAKAEREGMQHIFAQEVDRDYAASQANRIIDPVWIEAAIDAHLVIPYLLCAVPDTWAAGLDVADQGLDRNALAVRQWIILRDVEEWGERDAGVTTRRAIAAIRNHRGIKLQYDSIGIGAAVKAEYNRIITDDRTITRADVSLVPWNAGGKVVNPLYRVIPDDDGSLYNRDFFKNMKAQAWWSLRTRFYKTWRVVSAIRAGQPIPRYDPGELISLDSRMPLLHIVRKELAQAVKAESSTLQMIVQKAPEGTKSPNTADAIVMAYFPAPETGSDVVTGSYG